MSKSLNLYAGAIVGVGVTLTGAANFADRFVTPLPSEVRTMTDAPNSAYGLVIAAANAQPGPSEGPMGIGRKALPQEVAAWDLEISPDASELPEGSGSVMDGEVLFSDNCAVCHGEFAEGVGNWPKLSGGDGTLADEDPLKTVGSYWPYLSTAWDYVHRSMPYGGAQTLSADETYAITAYILYSNYLVEDDFVLTKDNFLEVDMPNADGFIVDDREEAEAHFWNDAPCMENCKDSVEITKRATVLDVTPQEETAEDIDIAVAEPAQAPTEPATQDAAVETAVETAELDADLVADGEKVFRKCQACHMVGDGAKNRVGPHLNGVMGRTIGGLDSFNYSGALADMGEAGKIWTAAEMAMFLENPREYAKGTKMSFAGLKKEDDQAAIVEYLKSHSQ